jgi:hypothetical protein
MSFARISRKVYSHGSRFWHGHFDICHDHDTSCRILRISYKNYPGCCPRDCEEPVTSIDFDFRHYQSFDGRHVYGPISEDGPEPTEKYILLVRRCISEEFRANFLRALSEDLGHNQPGENERRQREKERQRERETERMQDRERGVLEGLERSGESRRWAREIERLQQTTRKRQRRNQMLYEILHQPREKDREIERMIPRSRMPVLGISVVTYYRWYSH